LAQRLHATETDTHGEEKKEWDLLKTIILCTKSNKVSTVYSLKKDRYCDNALAGQAYRVPLVGDDKY
jgi:hypothetical protein